MNESEIKLETKVEERTPGVPPPCKARTWIAMAILTGLLFYWTFVGSATHPSLFERSNSLRMERKKAFLETQMKVFLEEKEKRNVDVDKKGNKW